MNHEEFFGNVYHEVSLSECCMIMIQYPYTLTIMFSVQRAVMILQVYGFDCLIKMVVLEMQVRKQTGYYEG